MKIINYDTEIPNPNLFIPDEVLIEIFRYLPLESVYKFVSFSKVRFSLLTKTLTTLGATHYAFYDGHLAVASPDLLSSSNFIYDGFSFKLMQSALQKLSAKLCLVCSSHGLVLSTIKYRRNHPLSYTVFNPLTKKSSYTIPSPDENHYQDQCFMHGFISKSSSTSSSTTFMVVRIRGFDNTSETYKHNIGRAPTKFEILVFSSELGDWCVYEVSSPPKVTWGKYKPRKGLSNYGNLSSDYDKVCFENIVISHNGVFYWFEGRRRNRVISYDMINNCNEDVRDRQCRLIDLPKGRDEEDFEYQCLGESVELLCYSQLQRKAMTLCIWVHNQSSTSEWELVHKIELKNMLACDNDRWFNKDYLYLDTEICPLAFHPVNRHTVLLEYGNAYILALNAQINRFEVLKRPAAEVEAYPWLRSDLPLVLTPMPTTIPQLPESKSSKRKPKSKS